MNKLYRYLCYAFNCFNQIIHFKLLDSPETVHMLSKGDIVYISSFVDIHSIYVRRINNGTDRFKSFLEKFSSCCALGTYNFFKK